MSHRPTIAAATLVLALVLPSNAWAQACLGLPVDQGQMAIQGEASADADGKQTAYGGRLAVNFDTEYSLEVGVRRPVYDRGRGTEIAGLIGYESPMYEPALCGVFGVRYEKWPTPDGDASTTLLPLGMGIGKRLGSANSFSLAIFMRPEYMYVLRPQPTGDFDTFWDELEHRSEGRGAVGVLLGTPFIYGTGAVEVSTRDNLTPSLALGVGVVF